MNDNNKKKCKDCKWSDFAGPTGVNLVCKNPRSNSYKIPVSYEAVCSIPKFDPDLLMLIYNNDI